MRFNPATAAKTGPAKKSFVQSLIPMPTRNRSRPEASDKDDKTKPAAHLDILRAGKAEPLPIKTGLSDGRYTEVSGEGLVEGMQVILRNNTPAS